MSSVLEPVGAGAQALRLSAENRELRLRLREAEDTLAAIRRGDVEALVVQTDDGPKVYSLTSADGVTSQLRGEMLAQISDAVLAVDMEQRITYLNAAAEHHLGCAGADALGRRLGQVVRIEWHAGSDESAARAALERHGIWSGECVHRLPDGRELAVEVTASRLRDAAGRPAGTLAVVRDVTQRRQADEALRRLTERYDAALAAASVVLFEQDETLRYTWVHNPLMSDNEWRIVGRLDGDLLTERPEDAQRLGAIKQSVLDSGQPRHEEVDMRVGGQTRHYELFAQPRRNAAGSVIGIICAAVDLTERKHEEQARLELAERLQLTLAHTGLGTWDWDLQTEALTWSPECFPIYGLPASGVEVNVAVFNELLHPQDAERVWAATRAAIEQHATFECEFRILRHDDGALRWVANLGRATYDTRGNGLRMIGTVADITERKRIEQALHEEAERKDEFLAMLAHELRNPLAPVRMTVGILAGCAEDDPLVARCRDIIDRQTAQMARLLDDLLDVSRLSRGKVTLQPARVQLGEVLDAALETCRPLIEQQSQRLVVDLSPEARALVLDADGARLMQVFSNLLNNAAKYSHPGGRIELRASAEEDHALVWVLDEGIGIAPDVLPRMFELFVQSSDARRHAPGGLGIGLALAYQLVQMHGGTLTASSAGLGRGSQFGVRLPLARPEAAADAAPPDEQAALRSRLQRRVLVADDNVDAADTTAMLLQALGCEVDVVYDGEAAVRDAERIRPEVVLLDLGMHGLDGYEACRRIRAQPWGMQMTLVALSGWSREEDRRRSAKAGFDLHLSKPVAPQELIEAVRDARPLDD